MIAQVLAFWDDLHRRAWISWFAFVVMAIGIAVIAATAAVHWLPEIESAWCSIKT